MCTSTQACAAAGSNGGTAPAGATVVLRFRYSQPNGYGVARAALPTATRCVPAGKAVTPPEGGCGANGMPVWIKTCSCSSKNEKPSWPNGYQLGLPLQAK